MHYALLIYAEEHVIPEMSDEERKAFFDRYGEFNREARGAGVFRAAGKLRDSQTATSCSTMAGRPPLLDGPYADTKEQLAGFYIVECEDLDTALHWARSLPGSSIGTIEVRPMAMFSGG
jgi:hypothetical protein